MIGGSAFLKGTAEKFCHIIFNAHCCENNGKFLIGILSQRGLLYDLCGQLIVRQTIAGKDGQLLATDQGGQSVDGGNTGVNIVTGIFTGYRVQRQSVDV